MRLIVAILIAVAFSGVNFRNSIYASRIDPENVMCTVAFLSCWAIWGIYEGYHNKKSFQLF